MPTITFSLKDLTNLLGKKITEQELTDLLEYAKAEVEHKNEDEITIKYNDTNQPYLWSPEGIAILLKGITGKEKGIPPLKTIKTNNKIIIDKSTQKIRPYISAFTAKGIKLTDYLLKQIIQLQEKLCENYGRKRQKIAVGLYPANKITFPLTYTTAPETLKFIPLGENQQMSIAEILEKHPKGKEYKWILEKDKKYPILIDSKKEILSFPPIINSQTTGKLETGEEHIFFEATGTDFDSVNLAANIFAYALNSRGYKISTITIQYPDNKTETPTLQTKKVKFDKKQVKDIIGIEFTEIEIKKLLEKMRYNYSNSIVQLPPFRQDIMHENDIIEDIAIAYGYNNIPELPITTYTRGSTTQLTALINTIRELLVGQGHQETFSAILSNKTIMQQKMKSKEELIEIDNYTTQTYSALRNSILPILLEILSQNKHVEYPQKLFEQGIVTKKKLNEYNDQETIAIVQSHTTTSFTEIRQTVEAMLRLLGCEFFLQETEHTSYVPGRVVEIIIKGENIGILGEIHPEVLQNFAIETPVVASEINIDKLNTILKK